jgi:hypothetical protein
LFSHLISEVIRMKKFIPISIFLCFTTIACTSSHAKYIKDNPDFLKYGLRASAFLEAWGKPDEVFAYQDYRNKQYSYTSVVRDSSGIELGGSYTPTTIVWIYREHKKALFFQQVPLLNEPRTIFSTMVWKLVGWEKLESKLSEPATKPVASPEKTDTVPTATPSSIQAKIVTVNWTFANIRSGAGNDYSVVTSVKQGDKLTVIGQLGDWSHVRLESGQQGWVSNKVLK